MSVPPIVEYIEALLGEKATRAAYRYLGLLVLALIVSALLYPFAWRDTVRTGILVGLLLYAAIDLPRTFLRARIQHSEKPNAFDNNDRME
jgi:uncharacterized protein (DUF58 family)